MFIFFLKSTSGIVYLVQPCELVGTNRYKIGISKNNSLNRCKNGYKNGTRYLSIMECEDVLILEKNIIKKFNQKFKLIGGNEYFEGNELEILVDFFELVIKHKKWNYIKKFYKWR